VKVGEQLREMWRQARRGRQAGNGERSRQVDLDAEVGAEAERKTLALPAILSPVQFPGKHLPKPTPMNLRRFAETPVVRRAINVIKDRIAAMDWQIRVRRGVQPNDVAFAARKLRALRCALRNWFTVSNATSSGPNPNGVKLRGFIRMYINCRSSSSTAPDSSCPGMACA